MLETLKGRSSSQAAGLQDDSSFSRYRRPIGDDVSVVADAGSDRRQRRQLALDLASEQPVGDHPDRQLGADGVTDLDVEAAVLLQQVAGRLRDLWKPERVTLSHVSKNHLVCFISKSGFSLV